MDFLKNLFAKVLALLTTTTASPTVNVEVKVNEAATTPAVLPVKKARKSKSPATKKAGTKKKPTLRVE